MLFLGKPEWAQGLYEKIKHYPFVPVFDVSGLTTAIKVQITLLSYWTLPLLCAVVAQVGLSYFLARQRVDGKLAEQVRSLAPRGEFYSVSVPGFSVGELPLPVVPYKTTLSPIKFVTERGDVIGPSGGNSYISLPVIGDAAVALQYCNNTELSLCSEIVALLSSYEGHYAGAGHGVDLLDHTFNVVDEAVKRCTPEFRLPLIAAFAHDIGKLITFKKDDKGEWERKGYHSREGARILASLPSFPKLPLVEQRALILVLKYEHTSAAIPIVAGDVQAKALASRVLMDLTQADKQATAAEKDRNLEKLQPEDLLWQDFVDNIRNVPVLQMGKTKVKNQINHPRNHPYIYLYEVPWREGAISRLPEEVAAALDLIRRDQGRLAKYTRIFTDRLRREGVLLETHGGMTVPPDNPLWNIRSGMMGKDLDMGQPVNGVIALDASALWAKLNFRLSTFSDFNVRIESPNADASGQVYAAQQDARAVPQLADTMSLGLSTAQVNKDRPPGEKASKDSSVIDRMDSKVAEQIGLVSQDTLGSTQKTRSATRRFGPQDTSAATKALVDITKGPERKIATQPLPPTPIPPKAPIAAAQVLLPATAATETSSAPATWTVSPTPALVPSVETKQNKPEKALTPEQPLSIPAKETPSSLAPSSSGRIDAESFELAAEETGDKEPEVFSDAGQSLSADEALLGQDSDSDEGGASARTQVEAPPDEDENAALPGQESALSLQDIGLEDSEQAVVVSSASASTSSQKLTFKPRELTVSEDRNGIGIADLAVCAAFPHLKTGDKYYTSRADLVKNGGVPAGTIYNKTNVAPAPPVKKDVSPAPSVPVSPQSSPKPNNSGQNKPGAPQGQKPANKENQPKPKTDGLAFLGQESNAPRKMRRF